MLYFGRISRALEKHRSLVALSLIVADPIIAGVLWRRYDPKIYDDIVMGLFSEVITMEGVVLYMKHKKLQML